MYQMQNIFQANSLQQINSGQRNVRWFVWHGLTAVHLLSFSPIWPITPPPVVPFTPFKRQLPCCRLRHERISNRQGCWRAHGPDHFQAQSIAAWGIWLHGWRPYMDHLNCFVIANTTTRFEVSRNMVCLGCWPQACWGTQAWGGLQPCEAVVCVHWLTKCKNGMINSAGIIMPANFCLPAHTIAMLRDLSNLFLHMRGQMWWPPHVLVSFLRLSEMCHVRFINLSCAALFCFALVMPCICNVRFLIAKG